MDAFMYHLVRQAPGPTAQTAVTGVVAEAVVFGDGIAVLHWLTEPRGTEFYPSEAAMRQIREGSGRSRFVQVVSETRARPRGGWPAASQHADQAHGLPATAANVMIGDYLEQHHGEIITEEQVLIATGAGKSGVRAFLREAGDRDWISQLPGGWRIP